jgi:hypothetical protein
VVGQVQGRDGDEPQSMQGKKRSSLFSTDPRIWEIWCRWLFLDATPTLVSQESHSYEVEGLTPYYIASVVLPKRSSSQEASTAEAALSDVGGLHTSRYLQVRFSIRQDPDGSRVIHVHTLFACDNSRVHRLQQSGHVTCIRRIDLSADAGHFRCLDSQGRVMQMPDRPTGPVVDLSGAFGSHTNVRALPFRTLAVLTAPDVKKALDAARESLLPELVDAFKDLGVSDISTARVTHNISIQQSAELTPVTPVAMPAVVTVASTTVITTTTVVSGAQSTAAPSGNNPSEEGPKPPKRRQRRHKHAKHRK